MIPIQVQTVDVAPKTDTAMVHYAFSPDLGGATVALDAVVKGKRIHVFADRDLTHFNVLYAKDSNAPFKQFNVPLFPLTNRLLPKNYTAKTETKVGTDFLADVEKISVKMPTNNVSAVTGSIAHHLHGLSFDAKAAKVVETKSDGGEQSLIELSDFFKGYWTSNANLQITQSIQNGEFHYKMTAKNIGQSPMPVGFGSHPYFQIPSGHASAITLKIPAHRLADIDNLDNVFPKGTLSPVTANADRLNFSVPKALPKGVIDNFFVLDPSQRKEVILEDKEANVRYRITGLTSNIIGVQVYYPGEGSVIAIEMVTNYPDPRSELWKDIATGMRVLNPGESAQYEYKIAVESL